MSNRLKLNADKTEFIWLATRQQLVKINASSLQFQNQTLTPFDRVRDLDVILDDGSARSQRCPQLLLPTPNCEVSGVP